MKEERTSDKKTQEVKEKRKTNKWLVFVTMPIRMFSVIFISYKIGLLIDEKNPHLGGWSVKIGTLLGVFVALLSVIEKVKKIAKDE